MVKLIYYNNIINLGDQLSPIIYEWILKEKNIIDESENITNFLSVGSILEADFFREDSVVWGTGIHYLEDISRIAYEVHDRYLDIRAVRGPITRKALAYAGYICPYIYGDPVILMPLIYSPDVNIKIEDVRLIQHINFKKTNVNVKEIDISTKDYKRAINEIVCSKKIISSSLHGIILAESYGIPAIFLSDSNNRELIKYYDWYKSTNRENIQIAYSIEEALHMKPMPLPDLTNMQHKIIDAFPVDIFKRKEIQRKREVVLFGVGDCFVRNIEKVLERVNVRYVFDNRKENWGLIGEIQCFSPDLLQDMKDIFVVIMVQKKEFVGQIKNQLESMGIYYYEVVAEWLRYLNYDNYIGRIDE